MAKHRNSVIVLVRIKIIAINIYWKYFSSLASTILLLWRPICKVDRVSNFRSAIWMMASVLLGAQSIGLFPFEIAYQIMNNHNLHSIA